MAIDVSHENRPRYLTVKASGTFEDIDDITYYVRYALSKALGAGVRRVLLDVHEAANNTDMLDVNSISESPFAQKATRGGFRVAALTMRDKLSIARAYETSLRNRSINYRLFLNKEEAEAWLLG